MFNEYERLETWLNSSRSPNWKYRELATVPEYVKNSHTGSSSTWSESLTDAENGVISKYSQRAPRRDNKPRPLVVGIPLVLDPDIAGRSNAISASNLQQVAAGNADYYFKQIRKLLLDYNIKNAIIRLGWESNCGCYPWGVPNPESNTVERQNYKNAYRRAHTIMTTDSDNRNDSFEFVFDTIGDGWESGDGQLLYPGDDIVDYIGMDVYDKGTLANRQTHWQTKILPKLTALETFAKSRKKPMVIPEFGLISKDDGGGDNAIYIENMARWVNARPVAFYGLWSRWTPIFNNLTSVSKLYPVYCSFPRDVNFVTKTYTCDRQNPPRVVNPLSSAALLRVFDEFQSANSTTQPSPARVIIQSILIPDNLEVGTPVAIRFTVANIGENVSAEASTIVTKVGTTEIFRRANIGTLNPGEIREFTTSWTPTAGAHTIQVTLSGQYTDTKSQSFTVAIPEPEDPIDPVLPDEILTFTDESAVRINNDKTLSTTILNTAVALSKVEFRQANNTLLYTDNSPPYELPITASMFAVNGDYTIKMRLTVASSGAVFDTSPLRVYVRYPDINRSGTVDITDLTAIIVNWTENRPSTTAIPAYDLDADGKIGLNDLTLIISRWSR
jgi:hypothetical protein